MRRCAICAGTADVVIGWCGSPRSVCGACRAAVQAAYERQPARHRTATGRRAWLAEQVEKRLGRWPRLAGHERGAA